MNRRERDGATCPFFVQDVYTTDVQRALILLSSLCLAACTGSILGSSSVSSSSSAQSSAPSVSSAPAKDVPTVTIRWVPKRMPTLIKGSPRQKLTLQLSGAKRFAQFVGVFGGNEFNLDQTKFTQTGALLKAWISLNGYNDELWVDREPSGALIVHQRNIDEQRPYLSVNRILAVIDLPPEYAVVAGY